MDNLFKRFLAVLALALFFGAASVGPASAQDQFGGFQEFVDRGSLKPFARDLGAVLGAATFHSGRSLGFSGFDVGVRSGMMFAPDKDNRALRGRGVSIFAMPYVQAEIGLPFSLDGFIRGGSFQGITVAGGGLRYALSKASDKPLKPQFLVSWSGHSVVHRDFSASHLGFNLVTSVQYKVLNPYVGVGFDRTRVVVRSAPRLDPTMQGLEQAVLVPRGTLGFSARPKPYLYLHGALTYTSASPGVDTGVGIRF
ncbi:MAG: hypothetical protein FD126_3469 [Elusimicrobia bacterium]|nr:MAG: hypothetical protein FD126_3469 [Elusimicrobiota bacterium]